MRLGYITSEYPHSKVKHAAGIGTSVKNLCVALARKGNDVTVFVYHQDQDAVFVDEGVTIHALKTKRFQFATWYYYRKHIQKYVNKVVKDHGIQLLEAPDWTGITAFMNFNIPIVIRFHGSDAYFCKLDQRKQNFKNFVFEKLALKSAKAYIAPTTYAGQETAKIFGLDRSNIKTIHNGLELSNFENEKPNFFDRYSILYIGTIIRKKGVFELAHIFNQVILNNPEARLTLIGSDARDIKTGSASTFELVKKEFTTKALSQVDFLGKIDYSEVKKHIKNAHVCVFPSFAETLGMVTIESMALQKPVVNTSIGWAQELIDDGINGFLVHPSEISKYAEKISCILSDDALRLNLGLEARKKVEKNFDINIIVDTNINFYQTLVN
ncbi:glycosyltransferase family 4 protein [Algibacter mikhailovii]|uniref:glycosyltransferase family 4 protein n=1 Tax=Algibacter mikhailovii TaxID=425498 RepID=UPI0024942C8D|nr:glycosyltransferase family 4 protein [Algibacter mikhailovii]